MLFGVGAAWIAVGELVGAFWILLGFLELLFTMWLLINDKNFRPLANPRLHTIMVVVIVIIVMCGIGLTQGTQPQQNLLVGNSLLIFGGCLMLVRVIWISMVRRKLNP